MDERHRQSVTVSAKTVDEAIAEAERELGVSREHLDITVITEGSKGFLGMRSENARILAMVLGSAPAPAAPAAPAPAPRRERAQPAPQPVAVQDEPFVDHEDDYAEEEDGAAEPGARAQERQETAAMAQEILETLLRKMEIDGRVSIRSAANPIVLDVETE